MSNDTSSHPPGDRPEATALTSCLHLPSLFLPPFVSSTFFSPCNFSIYELPPAVYEAEGHNNSSAWCSRPLLCGPNFPPRLHLCDSRLSSLQLGYCTSNPSAQAALPGLKCHYLGNTSSSKPPLDCNLLYKASPRSLKKVHPWTPPFKQALSLSACSHVRPSGDTAP